MMKPIENDGFHIDKIVNSTECAKHTASVGTPCWHLHISATKTLSPAICGSRIVKAGYNGQITNSSLSSKEKAVRGTSSPRRPKR